jgi:outer membrane protein assembly factor BamB
VSIYSIFSKIMIYFNDAEIFPQVLFARRTVDSLEERGLKALVPRIVLAVLLVSMLMLIFRFNVADVGEAEGAESIGVAEIVDWWPMFHHDPNHTGYSTSTAPNTNHTVWTYTTDNWIAYSSPSVVDGKVYVGSYDHNVYCLNASTGTHIWHYTTDNPVASSPAIVDAKVYVGSFDYNVYCLDALTGGKIWNYTTDNWVASSPAIVGSKVYVGSFDYNVYCLDALTGGKIWNYTTDNWVITDPAVANGRVYVGSYGGRVYCLDASTGAHVWNYSMGTIRTSPSVVDGKVYVGSDDKRVYCLNALTGAHIWHYTTGDPVRSSPAVVDGRVYVGSDDYKVYCLNATTGAHIWSYTTGNWVGSSPAVADGKVYVGSDDYSVYCLNASTGAYVWSYTTGERVISSPAVADGIVYVGSWDRKVYAFGPVHDVAVTAVTPSRTVVGQGFLLPINVTVKDEGTYTENFNVTLYYNDNVIDKRETTLTTMDSTTLAFTWNTTDVPLGNYTISALASTVADEIDTDDNICIGNVVEVRLPIHDIAVANVTSCKTVIGQGYSAHISITVENKGDYSETFNITAYANTTAIKSENITLAGGNSQTLTLTWHTTGFALGNYTLTAQASTVPNEANTTDNTYTCTYTIKLGIPGDVNGDGIVNTTDIYTELVLRFMRKNGEPGYAANADINDDGTINMKDIYTAILHFMQTEP